MTNPMVAATTMPVTDFDTLDAVLADFNLDETTSGDELGDFVLEGSDVMEDSVEEAPAAAASGVSNEDLADLDLAAARSEIYSEQTSANIETVEKVEPKAAAVKKARAPSGPKAERTPRDISKVPAEFFVLTGDASAMSSVDQEAARVSTMALKPAQVKVAEKFENLFTALSVGKAPSTYVMIAFGVLENKKTCTSGDIVGAYKASGLKEGTARSQSGQIMHLFATVGIASRSGQSLTLRSDSNVAERLRSLPASAASAAA